MMIPWDILFNLGIGATLKKPNTAVIFKMAARNYKILMTIYVAKFNRYQEDKGAIFVMMIP